jgi:hypothetical protein
MSEQNKSIVRRSFEDLFTQVQQLGVVPVAA